MKTFIEEELTKDNRGGLFSVGDTVELTNHNRVKFTQKIIGFNYDKQYNKDYSRFIYLDTDSFWFPHSETELKLVKEGQK